jgi:hypothetical protein
MFERRPALKPLKSFLSYAVHCSFRIGLAVIAVKKRCGEGYA